MRGFGSLEFKVGLLVLLIAGLIAWMSMKVAGGSGLFGGGQTHNFILDDAGGLVKQSAVKMAGIKVGYIEEIKLHQGRANVIIRLNQGVPVREGAFIEIRADGILGDRHVELISGPLKAPIISKTTQFPVESTGNSLDSIASEVSKITGSLSEFAKNLNKATGVGDETTSLGRIVINLENLTRDLAEITGRNKGRIGDIIDDVNAISSKLNTFIADENGQFDQAWTDVREVITTLNRTVDNFERVSQKLNDGTGTLGQLINDDETIKSVNNTIENINEFLGTAVQLETSIDYHSEFMTEKDRNKNYLMVQIVPGLDRFYELGIVTDPSGVVRTRRVESSGSTNDNFEQTTTFFDKLKYTALFGKNFYNFTVKGGIMESKGGVGLDYYLLQNDLRLSVEAFDFDDLYIRTFARYSVYHGIYLSGGIDNLLSSRNQDISGFIGAGIFITNDDLKVLASTFSF